LERSAGLDPQDDPGGFLQVSGLRFVIRGGHAEDIRVGGEPLRLDREYSLVTTDFLAAGGDGYSMLTRMDGQLDTGNLLVDLMAAALRERGQIHPIADGRISRED
jgi:2',3'-cyclic-nucleotide 2'-phosphodiesterase (5'-nucleotidase family)